MAKQVKLKAEPRPDVGRSAVRKLRARGFIPAVIYGGNDKPQPLQVSARDINAMMSQASGENVLVELEIGGDGTKPHGACAGSTTLACPWRDSSRGFSRDLDGPDDPG